MSKETHTLLVPRGGVIHIRSRPPKTDSIDSEALKKILAGYALPSTGFKIF